ncbi:hypothetical protein SprV_0401490100 [Sparganum proliferum]
MRQHKLIPAQVTSAALTPSGTRWTSSFETIEQSHVFTGLTTNTDKTVVMHQSPPTVAYSRIQCTDNPTTPTATSSTASASTPVASTMTTAPTPDARHPHALPPSVTAVSIIPATASAAATANSTCPTPITEQNSPDDPSTTTLTITPSSHFQRRGLCPTLSPSQPHIHPTHRPGRSHANMSHCRCRNSARNRNLHLPHPPSISTPSTQTQTASGPIRSNAYPHQQNSPQYRYT